MPSTYPVVFGEADRHITLRCNFLVVCDENYRPSVEILF